MYTPTGRPRGRPRKYVDTPGQDGGDAPPNDSAWTDPTPEETMQEVAAEVQPAVEQPPPVVEQKRETLWDVDDTLDAPPPDLSFMTREQMAGYAKRMFGRDIDPTQPVEQVRTLVRRLVSYGPSAPLW